MSIANLKIEIEKQELREECEAAGLRFVTDKLIETKSDPPIDWLGVFDGTVPESFRQGRGYWDVIEPYFTVHTPGHGYKAYRSARVKT